MGGSSSSNEIEPTEAEIAMAETASAMREQWKETGQPLEQEAVQRLTGYRWNAETKEHEIDPDGFLNADGTVRYETDIARSTHEAAMGRALDGANPNRLSSVEDSNREASASAGANAAGMAVQQQEAAQQGLVNAAAIGKGQEIEALERESDLAQQSASDAIESAYETDQHRAQNAQLAGQVIGAGGTLAFSHLNKAGSVDNTVTPRTPGDHHP